MRFIQLINYYLHQAYSATIAFWTPIDKGAVLGAIVALLVVFVQKQQQDRKDEKAQKLTEQNKLKYLNFLITDSFKVIEFYNRSALQITESYKINPFVIPDLNTYVPHSLNSIANKINQEEYYLASVNQLKIDEIAELLQLYNSLNDNYTKAVSHYQDQFPILIGEKDAYEFALNELIESLNQYILDNNKRILKGENKIIYNEIDSLMGIVKNTIPYVDRDEWLRDSKNIFVIRLNKIVEFRGDKTVHSLYTQSGELLRKHRFYTGRMFNIVNNIETNRRIQQDILIRINKVGLPLFEYIKRLKNS